MLLCRINRELRWLCDQVCGRLVSHEGAGHRLRSALASSSGGADPRGARAITHGTGGQMNNLAVGVVFAVLDPCGRW